MYEQKKDTPKNFLKCLSEKIGDYLLSHIASQYHRRKRA